MLRSYDENIVETGQVYWSTYSGKLITNINISSIFSELIQAAGMGCEFFASDLFYDLTEIKNAVENLENKVFFIGIRTHGVDGNSFVKERVKNKNCHEYIKLYRLEIVTGDNKQEIELRRCDEYTARKELCDD